MWQSIKNFFHSAKRHLNDFGVVISLFAYTLLVAGSTWAISTFLLKDNELNTLKAEISSIKATAEQYKSKSDSLQKDIEAITAENTEYKAWLNQTGNALPLIVPQLVELKKKVEFLSSQPWPSQIEPTQTGTATAPIDDGIEIPRTFTIPQTSRLGAANVDSTTGLIIAVADVSPNRTAKLRVTPPGEYSPNTYEIQAGSKIKIAWGRRAIQLTILEISWYGNSVLYELGITQ